MNDQTAIDHEFIRKLTEIIRANLGNEDFGVKELARETGMSRFNLNRKLHFISHKTISQFIREVRLERAMEMLQNDSLTASEISFKIGFSSPAYFSTCFSEHYGYPPGEVKKRNFSISEEKAEEISKVQGLEVQEPPRTVPKLAMITKDVWWAISFALFSILLILIVIYIKYPETFGNVNFTINKRLKPQDKSIAVLPFINDCRDPENVYFINGVLEAILDNLAKIKDLEVRPRTSVEKYRNNGNKTIPQIARELAVNYIIEGSGQKIGDQVSIYIQLIEASTDKHLFSQRYNMELKDIFTLQSEVAIKVATEIKSVITLEEKELIEKKPTANFAALNLFLQANDVHNVAESEKKWELDIKAERLYKRAIQLDSSYANPYVALGWIVSKRNIDSALYFANRALLFDAKNADAYTLKGYINYCKGLENEAEEAYKQSIKFKPNNSSAFRLLGDLYFDQGNCSGAIEYQLMAFHLENNSMQERDNVKSFCSSLYRLGFYNEGKKYASKLLELNNDSSYYYCGLASAELDMGNYESALKSALKMYACDTDDLNNIYELMYTYLYLRDFKEANHWLQKYTTILNRQGRKIEPDYLIGFIYFENGQIEEANFHFESIIQEMFQLLKQNQPSVNCFAYMTLAKIHSVRNEKTKAMKYLQKAKKSMGSTVYRIKDFKNCTMFDNIRNEPGFTEYLKEAEFRYNSEHEKVAKLLANEEVLISSKQ
ncbi:MAG: helix-turn-helix domain-containing protein [Prolixibacteraceae bacterium]